MMEFRATSKGAGKNESSLPESPEFVAQVRRHLQTLLADPLFVNAGRQSRFLEFIVEETLKGNVDRLKGYTIGIEVFDRPPDFDPTVDSVVRIAAARLRSKLTEYYEAHGDDESLRFRLPKGQYAVNFERVSPSAQGQGREAAGAADAPAAQASIPTVAVLPFTNFGGDPEQEYFADGITDDLIVALGRVEQIDVVARHSSFEFKGVAGRTSEVARTLRATHLLEGSVRRAGGRLRVNVQLVQGIDGKQLWSERYDRELADIFDVQDDITRRVVESLERRFSDVRFAINTRAHPRSIDAYDQCLRGKKLLEHWTQIGVRRAIEACDAAIQLDPDYTDAYIWRSRARVYVGISRWEGAPEPWYELGLADAEKAVELEPDEAFPHAMVGWACNWLHDGERARAAVDRASELGTADADALYMMSLVYSALGDGGRALELIERALQLNPIPPTYYYFAQGTAYFAKKELEEVKRFCRRGIEKHPDFFPNSWLLTATLGELGEMEEAERIFENYRWTGGNSISDSIALFFLDPSCRERFASGIKALDEYLARKKA